MLAAPDPEHVRYLAEALTELLAAPPHRVADLKRNPLYSQFTFQGVYAISSPDDSCVLYIGKTNDGVKERGLADRIWGHAETGSALQSSLCIERAAFSDLLVRAIRIDDSAPRGYLEHYAIAVLRPGGNRTHVRRQGQTR
jgi:hypothetical protein